jgi:cytochrome P450
MPDAVDTTEPVNITDMPSDLRNLLRKDPRSGLEKLSSFPAGIYCLARKPVLGAIVTDPNIVRAVLSDGGGRFQKSPAIGRFRYLLGDGTATSNFPPDGSDYYGDFKTLEEFRNYKRKVLLPSFKRDRVIRHTNVISQYNISSQDSWDDGQTRDVYMDMNKLMFDIMITALFNRDIKSVETDSVKSTLQSKDLIERRLHSSFCPVTGIFDRGIPFIDKLWLVLPGKDNAKLKNRHEDVEKSVKSLINGTSLNEKSKNGLIERLLEATDGHFGAKMSEEQFKTSVTGLFFAGYENSGTASAWLLWCLAKNPDIQSKVYEEVSSVFEETSDWELILGKLTYLESCIKEGLRLFPPVWSMAREVSEDVMLGSYHIPAKSVLIMSPWLQHRQASYWPDPERFMPERFLGGKIIKQGTYFPFGLGPRFCLGEGFAQIELKMTIALIIHKWRLKVVEDVNPIPQLGITQKPRDGIHLRLIRR